MLSEKEMEKAVIESPRKFIGEDGLKLISRQFRIGSYIFDLLFEDRFGSKLIIELQKGTLDRNHTYKILDYYHEYKNQHPEEFIELMLIANVIPLERKKRLKDWGISFKEISEKEFLGRNMQEDKSNEKLETVINDKKNKRIESNIKVPIQLKKIYESYNLFKEQKNLLIDKLNTIEFSTQILMNWKDLNQKNKENHINWFITFKPFNWGNSPGKIFPIRYGFAHHLIKSTNEQTVTFELVAQKPLKDKFKAPFKEEVTITAKQKGIIPKEFFVYPNASKKTGAYLIQARIPFNNDSWKTVFNLYCSLKDFNESVLLHIKKYNELGAFEGSIVFK